MELYIYFISRVVLHKAYSSLKAAVSVTSVVTEQFKGSDVFVSFGLTCSVCKLM